MAGVPQNGTTLGSEDPPVTSYLYEDLQCPACAAFAQGAQEARVREPGGTVIESHYLPEGG